MQLIGSFGDINFLVTTEKIRTYDEFVRSCTARWVTHEVIGKKPLSQFMGPSLDTVSFRMQFSVTHGLKPEYEMNRLIDMIRNGKPFTLNIGGKPLGVYKWVLTALEIQHKVVNNKGQLECIEVKVEMREYVK